MSQVNLSTSIGDCVVQHPQTSSVFETLNIDYCCGGARPLEQACRDRQLDPLQVLRQIEEAIHSFDKADVQSLGDADVQWHGESLAELCDHIEQTHHAYLKIELPQLTSMIAKVCQAHGEAHQELRQLQDVFRELRAELEPHMSKEEQVLFPAIRQLEQSNHKPTFPFGAVANPIRMMEHEHDVAGGGLEQLRRLTHEYTAAEGACNTYRVMLDRLSKLEANMHQHIHKENNILFPKAIALEQAKIDDQ